LISSHLEAGHYFNPHAQRVMEAKERGAKLIVMDTRLSNTATHADHWLPTYPGSEAAVCLSFAQHIIQHHLYDREFVRRWWNWKEYMQREHAGEPQTFEQFEAVLGDVYKDFTFEYAEAESGIPAGTLREVAGLVAGAGTRLSTHTWRAAAAGNLGGWQVSRALFLLNALLGAVATEGGVYPNAWNKFVPRPMYVPPHPEKWNELTWPREFPLALMEMSFLLPQLLEEGKHRVDVYFTRVYNPVWTNPNGFAWIEALTDESKIGLHAALTPTWNESAYFADYVLPMGHSSERHDLHSYETHDAQWLGFRQPVLRAARQRLGETIADTREVNPGEVWEENEFWIELSWRIDPDGALGVRKYFESKRVPGTKLGIDEYYAHIFENSVPGLPERAEAQGRMPLDYMRRNGAFEVNRRIGPLHEVEVAAAELDDVKVDGVGRVYTRAPRPASPNIVPLPTPEPDAEGRRPVGVDVDGTILRGFPTPSGRLEFYSSTLADWGWPEHAIPGYIKSHVHPDQLQKDQMVLISTFRVPIQVHTRSANSKWLDEIAHTNPLWLHPRDAARLGDVHTGDLVRVETDIGHFVLKAWVTEGIRPGVVACSHHMGRWKLADQGQRQMMATVGIDNQEERWSMARKRGAAPYPSADPDTARIWWTDVGVHQNLTFPVHPDPISGMHCWHQAVRVRRADPSDSYGDISVDLAKSREVYRKWLEMTRPAQQVSPDGTRRPYWMMRPLKPGHDAYRLPDSTPPGER